MTKWRIKANLVSLKVAGGNEDRIVRHDSWPKLVALIASAHMKYWKGNRTGKVKKTKKLKTVQNKTWPLESRSNGIQ